MTPHAAAPFQAFHRPQRAALHRPAIPPFVLVSLTKLGDVVAILAAGLLACTLTIPRSETIGLDKAGPLLLIALASTAIGVHLLGRFGVYTPAYLRDWSGRLARSGLALLASLPPVVLCIALLPSNHGLLPVWPALWAGSAILFLAAGHGVFGILVHRLGKAGRLSRRVAVVGLTDLSVGFMARASRQMYGDVEVIGCFRDGDDGPAAEHAGQRVMGEIKDVVERGRGERIDAVVLAIPLTQPARIARAKEALASMVTDIYLTTGLAGLQFEANEVRDIASTPMVRVQHRPLDPWQALQKSLFDRVFAAIVLLMLSPLLVLIVVLLKLDTPGPVLFRQPRLGFHGTLFKIYKFRTMHHLSADLLADRQTTRDDPRVTRLGRVLRRLSLDELPQLLNVLDGSMSLVGPRPHAPNTKAAGTLFHDAVGEYPLRHRVKPGITGWAQVNGWRGETRTLEQIQQRVAFDLAYIENWSLRMDLRIILMTVRHEFRSRNAY